MTPDTSGPGSSTPFAFYDPDLCCWRTSAGTFPWGSDEFSGTWPKQGMTRAGRAYEAVTLAHPTAESECLPLLPTPLTHDDHKTAEAHLAAKGPDAAISSLMLMARQAGERGGWSNRLLPPGSTAHNGDTLTEVLWKLGHPKLVEAGRLLPESSGAPTRPPSDDGKASTDPPLGPNTVDG